MPGAAIARPEPARSRDGGVARSPAIAGGSQRPRARPSVPRRCRGCGRHDPRDPKPGHAFDPPLAQPVVPDILMRAQPKGGWVVELNAETLPRVLVNNSYYARIRQATRSKAERDYLTERLHAANWLVKSLHQRATTILKVAAEIVRQQDAFFRYGVPSLRPLILRDIADAIGMHESTISRVTSNKYMATPRGLYELKYFFTSSIPASGGSGAHSAEAVRHRIRALIDGEPPDGTLSDERIVEMLNHEGVDIARRTVAKVPGGNAYPFLGSAAPGQAARAWKVRRHNGGQ